MKAFIAIVLIVVGIVLFAQGVKRKNSLVGHAATAETKVANSVDGGMRTPMHVGYMISGGVLVVIGLIVAFKGNRASPTPTP